MGEKIREDKEAMGECRLLDAQGYSILGQGKEPHEGGVPRPKRKLCGDEILGKLGRAQKIPSKKIGVECPESNRAAIAPSPQGRTNFWMIWRAEAMI